MRSGGGRGHRGHCRPGPGLCPCRKRTSWGPAGGQPPEAGGSRDCGAPSPGPSGAPHVRGSCWAVLPAAQPRLLREAVIALGLLPQVVVLHTLAHGPRAHLRNSACHPGPTPGRRLRPAACRHGAPPSHGVPAFCPRPRGSIHFVPTRHRPSRETTAGTEPPPRADGTRPGRSLLPRVSPAPQRSRPCARGAAPGCPRPHEPGSARTRASEDEGGRAAGCRLAEKPHGALWAVSPSGGSPQHGCSHDAGAPGWSQDGTETGAQVGLGPGWGSRAHTHCPLRPRTRHSPTGPARCKLRARMATRGGTWGSAPSETLLAAAPPALAWREN